MKLLVTIGLLMCSGLAMATPAVGDSAIFDLKIEQNGAYMLGQFEISLLAKDSAGNYQMRTTVTMEDSPADVRESMEEPKGFLTDETIQSALINCAGYGGKLSQYTLKSETSPMTVPTCIIPQTDEQGAPVGEIYIAQVAMGFVKQVQIESSTGRTVTLEMKSFTNGKGH